MGKDRCSDSAVDQAINGDAETVPLLGSIPTVGLVRLGWVNKQNLLIACTILGGILAGYGAWKDVCSDVEALQTSTTEMKATAEKASTDAKKSSDEIKGDVKDLGTRMGGVEKIQGEQVVEQKYTREDIAELKVLIQALPD